MRLLSKGFMLPALNADNTLLAGGNNSSIYVVNTNTNEVKYKLSKGYYIGFNEQNQMLCIEQNGKFSIYDPENATTLHQNRVPFRPEYLLPYFCWFDEDTIYFDYTEKSSPKTCNDRPIWHLVKYQISTQGFEELSLDGSIIGRWGDYLVMESDLEKDPTKPVRPALLFYKEDVLQKAVEIREDRSIQLINGELYHIYNKKGLRIFQLNKDFELQEIFCDLRYPKSAFGLEFFVSPKYVAVCAMRNEEVRVYNRADGKILLKEKVPYKQGLILVEDKLYVASMSSLYMFNIIK